MPRPCLRSCSVFSARPGPSSTSSSSRSSFGLWPPGPLGRDCFRGPWGACCCRVLAVPSAALLARAAVSRRRQRSSSLVFCAVAQARAPSQTTTFCWARALPLAGATGWASLGLRSGPTACGRPESSLSEAVFRNRVGLESRGLCGSGVVVLRSSGEQAEAGTSGERYLDCSGSVRVP